MKSNQKFSFERNRYYSGKMLTSADFQIEQEYVNHKRRFINRVMFGNGIVWGGSVYNLDDLFVMIESGAFIDSWGREIIIPQAEIRKLSAIDGFENIVSDRAYLCVAYDEENINPVYAVRQGEEKLECNHISEGYRFILIDENDMAEDFNIESEFLTEGEIVDNDEYNMKIVMPATVCLDKYVKVCFILKKKSDKDVKFSFSGTFQMPSLITEEGKNEYFLEMRDEGIKRGEVIKKELWVKAAACKPEDTKIILQPGTAKAYADEIPVDITENLVLDIAIDNVSPIRLVDSIMGKTNLEMRTMVSGSEYVRLAGINFKKTEQGYMILGIEEKSVRKYIEAPADGVLRGEFLDYFNHKEDRNAKVGKKADTDFKRHDNTEEKIYREGAFEIPLGKGAKKGETFYSDEIVCGSGDETMYIQLGFDACEEGGGDLSRNITIFGDSDIFKEKNHNDKALTHRKLNMPVAETAVKLYRDRGTFQAGIRFLRDYNNMILKCRWVAVRRPEAESAREKPKGMVGGKVGYISMEKPTLIMKPKESAYLHVRFTDMEPCPVTYGVNEYGGGEVTENGVYTAPAGEGVYEINVYCTNKPVISTFCYAVVRK